VIVLGLILLIVGLVIDMGILTTIGAILLVVGLLGVALTVVARIGTPWNGLGRPRGFSV
jgi:hypothetical protein